MNSIYKNITKKIRLIELFSGYGSQYIALRRIADNCESYKISEWCIPSNSSYKTMLEVVDKKYDNTNYSKNYIDKEIINKLKELGLSVDGKNPINEKFLKRKGINWCRKVFNEYISTNNLGNITNIKANDLKIIDKDIYTYIMTYSFPCQDLSLAGRQAGMRKGSNTRSGLLWEVERLLQESIDNNLELPDVLLMENVPQVCNKKNEKDFKEWKEFLENIGYKNFVKILNASDFGIPQNRKRCFMVSILTDKNITYNFPETIPLTKCVKDILEPFVDEKYYIKNDKANELIKSLLERQALTEERLLNRGSNTVIEEKVKQLGNILEENSFKNSQCKKVYDSNTYSGGNHEPKIIDMTIAAMRGRPIDNPNLRQAGLPTKQRLELNEKGVSNAITTVQKDNIVLERTIYDDYNGNIPNNQNVIGTITQTCGNNALRNGKKIIEKIGQISNKGSQCGTVVSDNGIFPTIVAGCHGYANPHICTDIHYNIYRIRRLTPKECGRLMDVDDKIIDAFSEIHSDSTLYKQFGSSIVVSVLCEILKKLL